MSRHNARTFLLRNFVLTWLKPFVFPIRLAQWRRSTGNERVVFSRPPGDLGKVTVGVGSIASSEIDVTFANSRTSVIIGNFVSIGRNLKIIDAHGHNPHAVTNANLPDAFDTDYSRENFSNRGTTRIESDVWIGDDVTILGGVAIGCGSVVGTKSLVTSDLPSYGIYGGNPAKLIRQRFSSDVATRLKELSWWNLPPDVIWKLQSLLASHSDSDVIERLSRAVAQFQSDPSLSKTGPDETEKQIPKR